MPNLPIIEFEGKTVKPKNGFYRCPFHCGNSNYPQPKWKTETGFRQHMAKCPLRPSVLEIQNKEEEDKRENELSKISHVIGETIYFVKKIIIKPTHEQRFNRMVRIRYEPVLRFEHGTTNIESINWSPNVGVYFNNGILLSELCASAEEAKIRAKEMQESWDESAVGTYERFVLALDLLHLIGMVNLSQGMIRREVS